MDALLADHGLFHLEADLRWIDVTAARLKRAGGNGACVMTSLTRAAAGRDRGSPDRGQGRVQVLRPDAGAGGREPGGAARRDPGGHGPERLGQVHAAALPGRHLHAGQRRGLVRRPAPGHAQRHQAHRAAADRLRLRVPVRPARARADRAPTTSRCRCCSTGSAGRPPTPGRTPGCPGSAWTAWAARRTGELSGGQAQRVALARALVAQPQGPVRRRADRLAGHADRRDGDGPAGRRRPRGGHHGRPGHPRRAGRRLRRPRGHGPRRQGHQPGRRPSVEVGR